MRILKHPLVELVFLSLPPLVVTLLQATRLEFPAVNLAGAPYNPWPRRIFNGVLLCVALGLIFWLIMRAGQSGWLSRRSMYARMALRFLFTGLGLLVMLLLIGLAVLQVFSAWSAMQIVNDLAEPGLEVPVQLGGNLALVEIVIVGAVWSGLFANWYIRATMQAERQRLNPSAD